MLIWLFQKMEQMDLARNSESPAQKEGWRRGPSPCAQWMVTALLGGGPCYCLLLQVGHQGQIRSFSLPKSSSWGLDLNSALFSSKAIFSGSYYASKTSEMPSSLAWHARPFAPGHQVLFLPFFPLLSVRTPATWKAPALCHSVSVPLLALFCLPTWPSPAGSAHPHWLPCLAAWMWPLPLWRPWGHCWGFSVLQHKSLWSRRCPTWDHTGRIGISSALCLPPADPGPWCSECAK